MSRQEHGRRDQGDRPGRRNIPDRRDWRRAGVSALRWYALTIGVGLVLIILLTALRAALPVVILAAVAIYVAVHVSGRSKPPSGGHRAGRGSED